MQGCIQALVMSGRLAVGLLLVPASWATVSFLRANIQAYVFLVEIELMLDVRAPRSMHVEDVLNRMLL